MRVSLGKVQILTSRGSSAACPLHLLRGPMLVTRLWEKTEKMYFSYRRCSVNPAFLVSSRSLFTVC